MARNEGVDVKAASEDAALDELAPVIVAARAWDGRLATALPLRQRVAALPSVERRGRDEGERALLVVSSAYRKRRADKLLADPQADREACAIYAPFLGDSALGAWPWHEPLRIGDGEAVRWLPLLGRYAAHDDPAVLDFVRTMFRVRRREVWIPAAQALAALARRSDECFAELRGLFGDSFRDGLPLAWPAQGLAGEPAPAKAAAAKLRAVAASAAAPEGARHRARHTLVAVCAWIGQGGDPASLALDVGRLVSMRLPKDDADAGAVLTALKQLLARPDLRPVVLGPLAERVRETPAEILAERVLRALAAELDGQEDAAPLVAAIEQRLVEPRWQREKSSKRLDAAWSFVENAAWLRGRGRHDAVARMRAAAAEVGTALALVVDGGAAPASEPVALLVERLREVLDLDVFLTTAPELRLARVLEILTLIARQEVGPLPWRRLVARACGPDVAAAMRDGAVGEVAHVELALLFAERDLGSALLLRDRALGEADVVRLAGSQDGFVARQVAVALERLLRDAQSPAAQVRLLWRTLQRDPPKVAFRELLSVLRGVETPLHAVLGAIGQLDELRRVNAVDVSDVVGAYQQLAKATVTLIEHGAAGAGDKAGEAATAEARAVEARLQGLATLTQAAAPCCEAALEVGSATWCRLLRELVIGDGGGDDGLDGWMRWLGLPLDNVAAAVRGFEDASRRAHSEGSAVTHEHCDAAAAALAALRRALAGLVWPENNVPALALARAEQWLAERRALAVRSERAGEMVRRLRNGGREAELVALVVKGDPILDCLPPEEARALSTFLLERLCFGAAHKLRTRLRDRVQLPALWTYLAPLYIGVAGGAFLVLDIGTAWSEVALPGRTLGYLATVAASLVVSFVLLTGNLAAHASASAPGAWRLAARALRLCWRVLPTYVTALAVAGATSCLTLWTLEGTSVRQVGDDVVPFLAQSVLWTSLSLFFGLFIGLVLQGRGFASRD